MTQQTELRIEREILHGGLLGAKSRKAYFAYLGDERIAHGQSRDEAKGLALWDLLQAYKYVGSTCHCRTANDGTIIIVRQTGDDCAQVEYNRNGQSSGITLGRMTNGIRSFTVREYADYLLQQYQA